MAMDKDALGQSIAARLVPINAPDDFKEKVTEVWVAVADEVIKHIETESGFPVSAELSFDVVVNRVGVGVATLRAQVAPGGS